MQALRDYGLAIESPGGAGDDVDPKDDPVAFQLSWSSNKIDTWLRSMFAHALTWLDNNQPLSDSEAYHWILLVRSASTRVKLTEFIKKGEINGQDLEKCRTPNKGKSWSASKIYFGSCSDSTEVFF
jgi:hypothetical protein